MPGMDRGRPVGRLCIARTEERRITTADSLFTDMDMARPSDDAANRRVYLSGALT